MCIRDRAIQNIITALNKKRITPKKKSSASSSASASASAPAEPIVRQKIIEHITTTEPTETTETIETPTSSKREEQGGDDDEDSYRGGNTELMSVLRDSLKEVKNLDGSISTNSPELVSVVAKYIKLQESLPPQTSGRKRQKVKTLKGIREFLKRLEDNK